MSDQVSKYQSYLLRLWRVDEDGHQVWRASLEYPRTGERHGFATPELLLEFLRNLTQKKEKEQDNSINQQND